MNHYSEWARIRWVTTRAAIRAVDELERIRLPARTLAHWAAIGIARPTVRWRRKRGRYNGRRYSLADLKIILLIVRLRKGGVSTQEIRRFLSGHERDLREHFKFHRKSIVRIHSGKINLYRHRLDLPSHLSTTDTLIPLGDLALETTRAASRQLEAD